MRRSPVVRSRVPLVLGTLAVSASLAGLAAITSADPLPAAAAKLAGSGADSPAIVQGLPDFTALVEKYGDAVVNVNVIAQRNVSSWGSRGRNDPYFEFFRRFGIPDFPRENLPPARGQGSGFIVSPDGYVLTNAHVVDNASEVTVILTDRREFTAKVVGLDERTDVAVLKIDAQNLPTVKFGDPSKLRPGEWVVAIGSPFGFENSVTAGVVSATSRALGTQNSIVPFIQTDVAVNPGNSGGPLFNMRGEVVGINSQIYSATGGYQGISFAIPIDVALNVQEQLIKTGYVTRGRIGVGIQPVTAQLAESFGLDRPRGALVRSVEEDGPAGKAGLRAGDVILSVNGQPVEHSNLLPSIVANLKPGSEVPFEIWRGGKTQRVTIRIGTLEEPNMQRVARRDGGNAAETERLGLAVRPLRPEEKENFKTEGSIVVEGVDGPAAAAGVQPGDIVLAVGNKPVKTIEELREAAKKAGNNVALLIQRQGEQIYVPIRVG